MLVAVLAGLALCVAAGVGFVALPGPWSHGLFFDVPGMGGWLGGLAGLVVGVIGLLVGLAVVLVVVPVALGAAGLAVLVALLAVAGVVLLVAGPVLLPLALLAGIVWLAVRAGRPPAPPAVGR